MTICQKPGCAEDCRECVSRDFYHSGLLGRLKEDFRPVSNPECPTCHGAGHYFEWEGEPGYQAPEVKDCDDCWPRRIGFKGRWYTDHESVEKDRKKLGMRTR